MNLRGFHGDLEIYIGILDDFLVIYWGFTGDFEVPWDLQWYLNHQQ